ncbi:polysaccharide biosynthesis/export family protein [Ferruginivarius sediminum]|uniref:Polysaccharide export protein n=1 Tax=Ferruginivarius sediminum TaxID=2661937 RepID=A0A369TGB7_9PROT|nr:polysaccharide biosynthesis/export family protein [Ferruginivarius sediminum]RDD63167.1 polysaccharide export protein [Ferruginivarius sediminum]
MVRLRIVFVAVLLIAMIASALPLRARDDARPYRLVPGDRIGVTVYGHEDLSGEFRLDRSGSVSLPLAGRVALDGETLRGAEAAIVRALRPDYLRSPRVTVQVLGHRPIYVLGEVEQPGRYPYERGLTVMGAIALAGGYTEHADRTAVSVLRARGSSRRGKPADEEDAVGPGDIVRVPERDLF